MTFARMSAHHHNTVRPFFQGIEHQIWMNHTGTHDPDGFHVRGIFKPGHPSKVSAGVGTPIAEKSDNCRFE